MAFIDDVKKLILSFNIDTNLAISQDECKDRKIAGLIDMHLISKSNNLHEKKFIICTEKHKQENNIETNDFTLEFPGDINEFFEKEFTGNIIEFYDKVRRIMKT